MFRSYTGHMLISQDENEEEKKRIQLTMIYTRAPGIFRFSFKNLIKFISVKRAVSHRMHIRQMVKGMLVESEDLASG